VTLLQERMRTEITRVPAATRQVTEWVLSVDGALAAAVGAYMFTPRPTGSSPDLPSPGSRHVHWSRHPARRRIRVFARRAYLADRSWTTQVVSGTGLMILALAGVVIFAVIWIL
jgi:hypothetical protein